MQKFLIVMVVALGIAGGVLTTPTPANAQTLNETLNLAANAEAGAKHVNSLADQLEKMVRETSKNEFLMAYASAETSHLGQRALAAARSLRRQGQAYELMADRLRDHARTLR